MPKIATTWCAPSGWTLASRAPLPGMICRWHINSWPTTGTLQVTWRFSSARPALVWVWENSDRSHRELIDYWLPAFEEETQKGIALEDLTMMPAQGLTSPKESTKSLFQEPGKP